MLKQQFCSLICFWLNLQHVKCANVQNSVHAQISFPSVHDAAEKITESLLVPHATSFQHSAPASFHGRMLWNVLCKISVQAQIPFKLQFAL